MFGIGAGEFVLILIVGLIVFGPSKLPEFGRSIGKLLREFRKAQSALSTTLNELDCEPSPNNKNESTSTNPHSASSSASNGASMNAANVDSNNVVNTVDNASSSLDMATQVPAVQNVNATDKPKPLKLNLAKDSSTSSASNTTLQSASTVKTFTTQEVTDIINSNPVKADSGALLNKETITQ